MIKIAEQNRRQSMKEGFWTFLEGTHPRFGENSPVRLLAGQTPVIKMISDYTLHQPQLGQQLLTVDDQINQILRFSVNRKTTFSLPFSDCVGYDPSYLRLRILRDNLSGR